MEEEATAIDGPMLYTHQSVVTTAHTGAIHDPMVLVRTKHGMLLALTDCQGAPYTYAPYAPACHIGSTQQEGGPTPRTVTSTTAATIAATNVADHHPM